MKLVVDPGALSKPKQIARVEQHLRQSPENLVVFTDFALEETCSGANAVGLRRTFRTIAQFPSQLQVLQSTPAICRLMPKREGLHERFIDELASNQLRTFCYNLFKNEKVIEKTIAERSKAAKTRMDSLLPAADGIRSDIRDQLGRLPANGIEILRKEGRLTTATANELATIVADNAIKMMDRFAGFTSPPKPTDAVYSFQVRFALAMCVLGLNWGVDGGLDTAKAHTLRNDTTDMTYVAYGTLYDGLVTSDDKMEALYARTCYLVRGLFRVDPSA